MALINRYFPPSNGLFPAVVLGWSQGGWIGPVAASRSTDIAFVVAVSGSSVSPLEQNIYDKTNQFAATGAPGESVKRFSETIRKVWSYLVFDKGREEAQVVVERASADSTIMAGCNHWPMLDRDGFMDSPRLQKFIIHSKFEPEPVLARLDVPFLAVFGGADRIVPVEASIEAMRRAFAEDRRD